MAETALHDRRRISRKDIRGSQKRKEQTLRYLTIFLLSPFLFLVFRLFNSHLVRVGVPLLILIPGFIFILYKLFVTKKLPTAFGVILIIPIFFSACLAFSDIDYFSQRTIMTVFPKNLAPSSQFILGTDYEGRDILSTIVIGGMNAYLVAMIATIVALLAGIPAGLLLTAKRETVRGIVSIITQFFEIIPQLFFVLIILGVYNFWSASEAATRLVSAYAIPIAGFAIGISSLPSVARIIESRVTQLQARRFVSALLASNVSKNKILWYNILWKNCISEIMVQATFLFGATILIESALGYAFEIGFGELGTGGYLSWGKILAESRRAILFGEHTWIVVFPIAVTIVSILGVNIVGDSLAKLLRNDS